MDQYSQIERSNYRCITCGYDLSGSAIGGNCPECGTPVEQTIRVSNENTGSSSTAVTCMVLGIVGIVACGLLGPFAIWLYYKARDEVATGKAPQSSMGMATAGLVLGWITTILTLVGCVIWGLLLSASM